MSHTIEAIEGIMACQLPVLQAHLSAMIQAGLKVCDGFYKQMHADTVLAIVEVARGDDAKIRRLETKLRDAIYRGFLAEIDSVFRRVEGMEDTTPKVRGGKVGPTFAVELEAFLNELMTAPSFQQFASRKRGA